MPPKRKAEAPLTRGAKKPKGYDSSEKEILLTKWQQEKTLFAQKKRRQTGSEPSNHEIATLFISWSVKLRDNTSISLVGRKLTLKTLNKWQLQGTHSDKKAGRPSYLQPASKMELFAKVEAAEQDPRTIMTPQTVRSVFLSCHRDTHCVVTVSQFKSTLYDLKLAELKAQNKPAFMAELPSDKTIKNILSELDLIATRTAQLQTLKRLEAKEDMRNFAAQGRSHARRYSSKPTRPD